MDSSAEIFQTNYMARLDIGGWVEANLSSAPVASTHYTISYVCGN